MVIQQVIWTPAKVEPLMLISIESVVPNQNIVTFSKFDDKLFQTDVYSHIEAGILKDCRIKGAT